MNRIRDNLNKHLFYGIFISILALLLLRTTGANAALAVSCGQWNIAKSPGTGAGPTTLSGVTALSATDVWAVGNISKSNLGPAQTLIERWNGKQWKIVASPNVPLVTNVLNAVAAVSADDIWAVGDTSDNNGMGQTLIEHWDGTQWSIVASPNPPSSVLPFLFGVAAVSANDVWAVGSYETTQASFLTLIEHWDGTQWSIISSPNVNGAAANYLYGVSALSTTNIWAAGDYDQQLDGKDQTLIEHWNGTQWSIVKSPNIPSNINDLRGIVATSSKEVWAVGSYQNDLGSSPQTLIERWNGKQWSIVTSPNPSTDASLWAVAAVSSKDVWAVGNYFDNSGSMQTLIEQWVGMQWRVVSSPNIPSADHFLDAVAASSANNVWTVGDYFSHTDNLYHTLTEFYC